MANQEHLDILMQGIAVWNKWREDNREIMVDLSDAHLRLAILSGADFINADLSGADLSGADLSSATFVDADLNSADLSSTKLVDADLSEANISFTDLSSADLSRADLKGAYLGFSNFNQAVLQDANFNNAWIGYAIFANNDLSSVKGVETVEHDGPSTIGVDTIYKSGGQIPESFLRGCGVPDTFIAFAKSLVGKAIDYYSAFISYSSKNQAFVERLYTDLQSKGVRCWYAPEDLKIGEKIRVGIDESIRAHDKLLLVLSKHSVESEWVEKEVETAMELERKQKRLVLFPVMLDSAVLKIASGWPGDIRRSRNIGDFRKWKNHDSYSKAFERLLRDLKAEDNA